MKLERCHILGLDRLNFHPGSHLVKIPKKDPEYMDKLDASRTWIV